MMIFLPLVWLLVWVVAGFPVDGDTGVVFLGTGVWAFGMAALSILAEAVSVLKLVLFKIFEATCDDEEETDV